MWADTRVEQVKSFGGSYRDLIEVKNLIGILSSREMTVMTPPLDTTSSLQPSSRTTMPADDNHKHSSITAEEKVETAKQ